MSEQELKELRRLAERAVGSPAWEAVLSLLDTIDTLQAENALAMREATGLATTLWRRHYQDAAPQWGLCDSLCGVLSQIDNMVAGLQSELSRLTAEREGKVLCDAEPAMYCYRINGAHDGYSDELPDDDTYDEGTLRPLYAPAEANNGK